MHSPSLLKHEVGDVGLRLGSDTGLRSLGAPACILLLPLSSLANLRDFTSPIACTSISVFWPRLHVRLIIPNARDGVGVDADVELSTLLIGEPDSQQEGMK